MCRVEVLTRQKSSITINAFPPSFLVVFPFPAWLWLVAVATSFMTLSFPPSFSSLFLCPVGCGVFESEERACVGG